MLLLGFYSENDLLDATCMGKDEKYSGLCIEKHETLKLMRKCYVESFLLKHATNNGKLVMITNKNM